MLIQYNYATTAKTLSPKGNASSSWSTVDNTGYLPMAGLDKSRFSTSKNFKEEPSQQIFTSFGKNQVNTEYIW